MGNRMCLYRGIFRRQIYDFKNYYIPLPPYSALISSFYDICEIRYCTASLLRCSTSTSLLPNTFSMVGPS